MHSSTSTLLHRPLAAGPQRHSLIIPLLPLQAHPSWDSLRDNDTNNVYFHLLDPLVNMSFAATTSAGNCYSSCKKRMLVKMGHRGVTKEWNGFRCVSCSKCWWFFPMPHREDDNDHSLDVFLWDNEHKSRVPTNVWLPLLCDVTTPCGVDLYVCFDEYGRSYVPPQYWTPPSDPCQGYITQWPHGVLNFQFGLQFPPSRRT